MATSEEVAAMQKEAMYVMAKGESFFLDNIEQICTERLGAHFVAIDVDHNRFVTAASRKEVHDKADEAFSQGSRIYVRGIEKVSPDIIFGPGITETNDAR